MNQQDRIREVVRRVAGKEVDSVPEESLFDSGVLDSHAFPDLVSALEQEYAIRIPDSDLSARKFESLASIEAYLNSKS